MQQVFTSFFKLLRSFQDRKRIENILVFEAENTLCLISYTSLLSARPHRPRLGTELTLTGCIISSPLVRNINLRVTQARATKSDSYRQTRGYEGSFREFPIPFWREWFDPLTPGRSPNLFDKCGGFFNVLEVWSVSWNYLKPGPFGSDPNTLPIKCCYAFYQLPFSELEQPPSDRTDNICAVRQGVWTPWPNLVTLTLI